ncbi:MAG: metabolite traffic protein EboE [Kiritimatiellae bacterium]|jgi:sugar phosphate isomerase/epimerase|nr:metabolite traffic protein EboE [Kiritimatiellia bacterium]
MRLSHDRHFSYCLNVHPGESLEDVRRVLRTQIPDIKQTLSPDAPFGLGLRIAHQASLDLKQPGQLDRFKQELKQAGCYAYTLNGFPYGAFHHTRVKENVYLPDWSSPDRLSYTCDLFDQLAALLPDGVGGSISTVPLGYKYTPTPVASETYMAHLLSVAKHLGRIETKTGTELHLGLEPEPDCLLETTDEAVAFFEQLFEASGSDEHLVRRHIGICMDTCHVAMQFEDPEASLHQLEQAGIRLSKVQISAALECDADSIHPEGLHDFDDGVYLHQVKSSTGRSWRDIPEYLQSPDPDAGCLRIHAHVPLHWPGTAELRSTRHTLSPGFWQALRESNCRHLEVETYTFNVLPEAVREGNSIARDMISECKWALERVG